MISSEDLDAAGFIAAATSGATRLREHPYLEQQVDLLRQSLEVLGEHVQSQSEDLQIVGADVRAIQVVITEHLGAVLADPNAEVPLCTEKLLVRGLRRLRHLRRTGHT